MKRSLSLPLSLAVSLCLLAVSAHGATSTWDAGGGATTTWATPANWNLDTLPASGDMAVFTGATNRTVTIDASNPAIDTVNVSGSAQWVFAGTATLTVATAFNYSDTYLPPYGTAPASVYTQAGYSHIDAILAGNMSLTVSAGGLDLDNAGNTFSGGVYINGGALAVGKLDGDLGGGTLGMGTVYIGDTNPGNTDASLYLADAWNANNYTQNIVVRAGNSGQAVIGMWDSRATGAVHSGTVTLNKDVTFVNNNRWDDIGTATSANLDQSGAITGTGNVTFSGIGSCSFSGTNSYTGATNISGGFLRITGTANTNLGNFTVSGGMLFVASDGSLGDPANTITLGSTGRFGGLGTTTGTPAINRSIALTGNGGVIPSRGQGAPDITGSIGGTGRLIYAASATGYLDNNNPFSGGLTVADGTLDINGSGNYNQAVYGTGNITVEQGGSLYIRGAANVNTAGGATVLVKRQGNSGLSPLGGILYLASDVIPAIDPASNGVIAMYGYSGAAVNAALGGATPIGDGTMSLGGYNWTMSYYSGTSIQALVANQTAAGDGSKTYHLSGNGSYNLDAPGINGALADLTDGTVMNVQIGTQGLASGGEHWIQLGDNNTFSGTLTLNRYIGVRAYANSASDSALGAAGGNVVLRGSGVDWFLWWVGQPGGQTLALINNTSGAVSIAKNNLSYDGSVYLNVSDNGSDSRATCLTAASLTRVGNSVLSVRGVYSDIGNIERFAVTANPTPTNNMVAPYIWNGLTNEFLTYDTVNTPSTGFNRVTASSTGVVSAISGASPTSIVYTAGEAVSGTPEIYALRTTGALTGGTVKVDSGGVILAPAAPITCTTNFNFGAAEAVLITPTSTVTLSGTLTGSGGLTKAGYTNLILTGDNSLTLSGNVTINEGTLYVAGVAGTGNGGTVTALGSGSVVLNGGTLAVSGTYPFFSTVIANNIVLGTNGGTLHGFDGSSGLNIVHYTGNISGGAGTGPLMLDSCNGLWIEGTNNTYTGGTIIGGNTLNVQVSAGACLGTGDVVVNGGGRFYLYGDANINAQARLILQTWNASANFESNNPVIGSLEGNGSVILGQYAHQIYTLTLGGNNASTDFYGTIGDCGRTFALGIDHWLTSTGSITKVGTGTFTMWGENWYSGTTTVNNGRLVNNGLITGNVVVTPGGVDSSPAPIYDGTGTTGGSVEIDTGGRLQGGGYFKSGVTVFGGTVNVTGATVDGGLYMDVGASGIGSYNGSSTINGDSVNFGGTISGAHTFNGGLTLDSWDGSASITGTNVINGSLNVGTYGDAASVSGTTVVNAGSGGTVELDAGTIGGTNNVFNCGTVYVNGGAYNGTSTVNAAWFEVMPGATVTGTHIINGNVYMFGGTFKGGHTIHGNLTAAASSFAVISPSNDGIIASTLTVVGNVTLDPTTVLNFKLGAPGTFGGGSDYIAISGPPGAGNLILDGTLNLTALGGFHTGLYHLMTYTGSITDNGLNIGTTPDSNLLYTVQTGGGDVDLTVAARYALGDVNHDGAVNSLDIDDIYRHFGGGSQWDVNGDGAVNQADVTFELTDAGIGLKTEYGDANLDHKVNFTDFQVLLDHWQATGGVWATGDFNGDTVVNFGDFQKLLDYWNPAGYGSSVPEPTTLALLGLGAMGLASRKRRNS